MTEREISNRNNNPELIPTPSGLTQKHVDPTLRSGDIFMPDEHVEGDPQQPELNTGPQSRDRLRDFRVSTRRKLRMKRGAGPSQTQEASGSRPLGFEAWPVDLKAAWEAEQKARATGADISRRDASTQAVIDKSGIREILIPLNETTPEKVEELKKLLSQQLDGAGLTSDQLQEGQRRLQEIMLTDPKNFAKLFTKAMSELKIPEAEAKRILDTDGKKAVEQVLEEMEGELPAQSVARFRRELEEALKLQTEFAAPKIGNLIGKIKREPSRLEKQAARKSSTTESSESEKEKKQEIPTAREAFEFAESIEESIRHELAGEENRKKFQDKVNNILENSGDPSLVKQQLIELQEDLDREVDTIANLKALRHERIQIRPPARTEEDIEELIQEKKTDISGKISGILNKIFSMTESNFEQKFAELEGDEAYTAMVGALYREKETYTKEKNEAIRNERTGFMNRIRAAASAGSIDSRKAALSELIRTLGQRYREDELREGKDTYNPVTNIQELGSYIAKTHGQDLWGEDGVYPIIEKGIFHPENMIIWVREQTNRMHADNRSDAISPLGSIHINTGFRDVSLYEMVRLNRQRFMKDKVTGAILDDLAEELIQEAWGFGQIRNASLAYVQIMNEDKKLPEAISQIHARSDLTHGELMRYFFRMSDKYEGKGGDMKVGRAVLLANDIYYNLPDWEQLVVTLGGAEAAGFSQRFRKEQPRIVKGIEEQLKGQNLSRDAYASAFQRLYEAKVLESIGNITTFTTSDFEDAIRVLQNKNDWEDIDTYDGFYTKGENGRFYCKNPDSKITTPLELFDRNGKFNIFNFVNGMNIYNDANPALSKVDLIRELVRLKVAQKQGLGAGIAREWDGVDGKNARKLTWEGIRDAQKILAKERGLSEEDALKAGEKEATRQMRDIKRDADRVNIKFAENLAESFQRPYGGAARNDTNRRGYDALTKLFLEEYLIRQSEAGRAGPVGVREAVGIYRNLGPDMWTALKTETGWSPLEIFGKIRDIENSNLTAEQKQKQIKDWIEELKFNTSAEKDVAGNIQSRGFQMFHAQTGGERIDLDKLVTYDPWTGVKINLGEWEEKFNDGVIKPARYFGSTNGGMKFSSKERRLDPIATKRNGVPTYEEISLAEGSYSPEIIGLMKNHLANKFGISAKRIDLGNLDKLGAVGKEIAQYIDYGAGRLQMVKYGLALDLGAQLLHHRSMRGLAPKWGYVRTEAFVRALKSMEELESDGKGGTINTGKRFFDDEIIEIIREKGRSKAWKLAAEDIGSEAAGPLVAALLEMLVRLGQASLKAS